MLCALAGLALAVWGFISALTVDEYARDTVESIFKGLVLILGGLSIATIPHALVSAYTKLEALQNSAAVDEGEEESR